MKRIQNPKINEEKNDPEKTLNRKAETHQGL